MKKAQIVKLVTAITMFSFLSINPIYAAEDTAITNLKQTGKAYVILEDPDMEDIFINSNNTYQALNGDTVKVRLFPKRRTKKFKLKRNQLCAFYQVDFIFYGGTI